ncbi:MAG: tetratricopeptide (TPR) repeat protein [Planctomycetota bacterium]|jgi:tetratricopeptide (TPR) repeat protein
MRMRQEQVVFCAGIALLGLLSYGLFQTAPAGRRSTRASGDSEELEQQVVPEVANALQDNEIVPAGRRALFAPPSDTHALALLALVEPPRRALASLLPVTDPGPAPAVFGQLLRRSGQLDRTPGLFEGVVGSLGGGSLPSGEFFDAPFDVNASVDNEATGASPATFLDETPEERAARVNGYRARYDWLSLRAGAPMFGRIENTERYGLLLDSERASEAILFVEIDPETGLETLRLTGAVAIAIERTGVREFGFATTTANELVIRDLTLGDDVTRGSYGERMAFAAWCIENRLEADKALAVARRVYRGLAAFDEGDPEPRLGLARALEAGFDFDGALLEYRGMLEAFPLSAVAHVGLANLEARFLLFEQAEERLRHAVSIDGGSWVGLRALGVFLYKQGEHEEAVGILESANRSAPTDPADLPVRVGIRNELGMALLALGDLEGASRAFSSAGSADERDQRALAGRMVCALLSDDGGGDDGGGAGAAMALADEAALDPDYELGYELALARGLAAVVLGDGAQAEAEFSAAVELDPMRASTPLAALAFVAEGTGYPDEAIELAERAIEADPGNAYAHYLRGRLLGDRDAYEEARDSLIAALEIDLNFEDALVAMGEMAFRLGRFEDAERYLERAVDLEVEAGLERAEVYALRGLNLLRLERVGEAREAFEASRGLDFVDPLALAGMAWCTYLDGDSTEALVQLADLDEARREKDEADPWRLWARSQQDRITDHVSKEEWVDNLERKRLLKNWQTDEKSGPLVSMDEGSVLIDGAFQRPGLARVYRVEQAGLFVSFEASIWIDVTNARTGIFIAREKPRAGVNVVTDEVSVSRHKDGTTQVRFIRAGQQPSEIDMESSFPTGRWVRLRIERKGEGSETRVTVSMDGVPLLENMRAPTIASGSNNLLMGVFVEGEVGREASVRMDDVSVVRHLR